MAHYSFISSILLHLKLVQCDQMMSYYTILLPSYLITWTSWRDRISDEEVCWCTGTDQPPLIHNIHTTRLKFFGHIAHTDPSMGHSRALSSSVAPAPRDWNCRSGRRRQTWPCTVESDVAPLNIGLATACHRAQNWQA